MHPRSIYRLAARRAALSVVLDNGLSDASGDERQVFRPWVALPEALETYGRVHFVDVPPKVDCTPALAAGAPSCRRPAPPQTYKRPLSTSSAHAALSAGSDERPALIVASSSCGMFDSLTIAPGREVDAADVIQGDRDDKADVMSCCTSSVVLARFGGELDVEDARVCGEHLPAHLAYPVLRTSAAPSSLSLKSSHVAQSCSCESGGEGRPETGLPARVSRPPSSTRAELRHTRPTWQTRSRVCLSLSSAIALWALMSHAVREKLPEGRVSAQWEPSSLPCHGELPVARAGPSHFLRCQLWIRTTLPSSPIRTEQRRSRHFPSSCSFTPNLAFPFTPPPPLSRARLPTHSPYKPPARLFLRPCMHN